MVARCPRCHFRFDAPAGILPPCPQCNGATVSADEIVIESQREIPNPPRTIKFSRRQVLRAS